MIIKFSELKGKKIIATDDEFGRISDLLVDERNWHCRYIVIDTHRWIPGRQIVLSPQSLHDQKPITSDGHLKVKLTRQQVERAPILEENLPISRQYESSLFSYYGWTPYWATPYSTYSGTFPYPATAYPESYRIPEDVPTNWNDIQEMRRSRYETNDDREENHLRSCVEMKDYKIRATDEDFGEVSDFLIDTDGWYVLDLLLSSRRWLPGGKKSVCSPMFVTDINYIDRVIKIALDKETILNAPEFDLSDYGAEYRVELVRYYMQHRRSHGKQESPPHSA